MSRVTLIQHINIQVSNRERTREWYEKVLGAEFLDRGPELNKRQLQLRIGSAEIHTTHTAEPVPSGHFAVEIPDWDEMIANLDKLGVPYNTRTRASPRQAAPTMDAASIAAATRPTFRIRMGTPSSSCTIRWGRRTPRGTRSSSPMTPKA